jgi:hypothetical protein
MCIFIKSITICQYRVDILLVLHQFWLLYMFRSIVIIKWVANLNHQVSCHSRRTQPIILHSDTMLDYSQENAENSVQNVPQINCILLFEREKLHQPKIGHTLLIVHENLFCQWPYQMALASTTSHRIIAINAGTSPAVCFYLRKHRQGNGWYTLSAQYTNGYKTTKICRQKKNQGVNMASIFPMNQKLYPLQERQKMWIKSCWRNIFTCQSKHVLWISKRDSYHNHVWTTDRMNSLLATK